MCAGPSMRFRTYAFPDVRVSRHDGAPSEAVDRRSTGQLCQIVTGQYRNLLNMSVVATSLTSNDENHSDRAPVDVAA